MRHTVVLTHCQCCNARFNTIQVLGDTCPLCNWTQDTIEKGGYSWANRVTVETYRTLVIPSYQSRIEREQAEADAQNAKFPDKIGSAAIAMSSGASPEDVVNMLAESDLNGYQIWLTYKAAELLLKDQ